MEDFESARIGSIASTGAELLQTTCYKNNRNWTSCSGFLLHMLGPPPVPPIMTYQQTCLSSVTEEPDDTEQLYFANEGDKTVFPPASFLIFVYQLLKEVSATYHWHHCNNSSNKLSSSVSSDKLNTERPFVTAKVQVTFQINQTVGKSSTEFEPHQHLLSMTYVLGQVWLSVDGSSFLGQLDSFNTQNFF